MSIIETMIDIPAEHEKNVCGQFDSYLKKIERTLHVTMVSRDGAIKVIGPEVSVRKAKSVFNNLIELSKRGNEITQQNVDYALSLSFSESDNQILEIDKDVICHTTNGRPVKPKTMGQKNYVDAIRKKMVVFGIGPAGTGKTYLAMAMGIQAFKDGEVGRIILTRPAIEAGEKLGEALAAVTLREIKLPYLANVTADYVREAEAVKPLLKQQVCAPVRWQQSVERLLADGVDTFVEIGPGHTLSGFMKKILKQAEVPADTVQVYNVETMDDFKEYMSK